MRLKTLNEVTGKKLAIIERTYNYFICFTNKVDSLRSRMSSQRRQLNSPQC